MSKYAPLRAYLEARKGRELRLSFDEIEQILGFSLPQSKKERAWWSNNPWNNVMTKAWLAAGFKTADVDVPGETLLFVPDETTSGGLGEMKQETFKSPTAGNASPSKEAPAKDGKPHPLWGIWVGKVTLLPDYDYTQPADPDWGKVYDE